MIMTKITNQLRKGFTGSTLKIIAIVAMLIDHIGATILEKGILKEILGLPTPELVAALDATPTLHIWYIAYYICRHIIGRIAFPLFCLLLIEGFLHTKDLKKYALRLLAFAFISEVPFDFAFRQTMLEFQRQNIFFTLFIGLLVLIGLKKFEEKSLQKRLMQMNIIIAGMIIANFLNTDYGALGIVLIAILYLLREKGLHRMLFCAIPLSMSGSSFGILAFIPTQFYNGERGLKLKYVFYLFYPIHLLILGGILYFLF
jgi:TraX protein.